MKEYYSINKLIEETTKVRRIKMTKKLLEITIYKDSDNKIQGNIGALSTLSKKKVIRLLKDFIKSYKKFGKE